LVHISEEDDLSRFRKIFMIQNFDEEFKRLAPVGK